MEEAMKKKSLLVLTALITIIIIPVLYYVCSDTDDFKKTLVMNNEKEMTQTSSSVIDSNEIIYNSDKPIDLVEGDIINLELSLKNNELNTPHSLTICFMKVEANMNKTGIINLIGNFNGSNSSSEFLSYKTLDLEKILTTSFEVTSDGKYIIFVLDKEKIISPSNLNVKCEFTIGGNDYEIDESDSSVLKL